MCFTGPQFVLVVGKRLNRSLGDENPTLYGLVFSIAKIH